MSGYAVVDCCCGIGIDVILHGIPQANKVYTFDVEVSEGQVIPGSECRLAYRSQAVVRRF